MMTVLKTSLSSLGGQWGNIIVRPVVSSWGDHPAPSDWFKTSSISMKYLDLLDMTRSIESSERQSSLAICVDGGRGSAL